MSNELKEGLTPENVNFAVNIRKQQDIGKIPYWIKCGEALLGDDEVMKEKWSWFIDKTVNGIYGGIGIDEMLQIMSMFKMNMPMNYIKEIYDQMPESEIVIGYLGMFVHPDLLDGLTTRFSKN